MPDPSTANWSRRDVLRGFSAALATAVAGCAPARIILGAYPAAFKHDADLNDRVLRAFVATIVPGIPLDEPNLAKAFSDDFFPFAKYRAFFASDLCRRAGKLCRNESFDQLSLPQRTRVVQNGLQADSVTRRLYRGAIRLAQAATYGGIYNKHGDVPLIDFEGFRYAHGNPDACTYPDPQRFFAPTLSPDGNPA